jgi:hypothetical protein
LTLRYWLMMRESMVAMWLSCEGLSYVGASIKSS